MNVFVDLGVSFKLGSRESKVLICRSKTIWNNPRFWTHLAVRMSLVLSPFRLTAEVLPQMPPSLAVGKLIGNVSRNDSDAMFHIQLATPKKTHKSAQSS